MVSPPPDTYLTRIALAIERGYDAGGRCPRMLFVSARVRNGAGKSPLFGDCREIWRRIGGVFRGGRLLFQFPLCFAFQLFALIVLTRTLFLAFVEARSTSAWHRRL